MTPPPTVSDLSAPTHSQPIATDPLIETERDARAVLEGIPGFVAILGPDGSIEVVNRRILEYCGQPLDELRSWGTNGTVHKDDMPHVAEIFGKSMLAGTPYYIEQRLRRFDGTYRWFGNSGVPIKDDCGQVLRWYVLLTDVDERRRAEEAVRASEVNLRFIIDTIPALAWSANPDGTAEFFNQHYLDYVGLTLQQVQGWQWISVIHPDDLGIMEREWASFRAAGVAGEIVARMRRHDGVCRWFLFRANPVRDEHGNVVKWYGVNTDIEDHKRAEALLAGEKLLLEMVASGRSVPEVLGALCKVVEGAAPGCFCDVHLIDWRGPTIQYSVAPSLPASFTDPIAGTALCGRLVPCGVAADQKAQVVAEDIESDPRWHTSPLRAHVLSHGLRSMWSTPVCSRKGDVLATLCIYQRQPASPLAHHQDVIGRATHIASIAIERLQSEQALDQARSDMAHVTRVMSLGTLTASIAHEINQPLSGIMTNANTSVLMLSANPPNVAGALEAARRTLRDANRSSEVVARLRELFSKRTTMSEKLDLNEAALEVVTLLSSDLQRNRVLVRTDLAPDLPAITADRVQLQQVILNLLRNASDAMSDVHDRQRLVVISTAREGADQVLLSVQDSGKGFASEQAELLFQPLYTTKSSGMGIGLSVSRTIIESHHGRVWAECGATCGATFTFSIPIELPGLGKG